MQQYFSLKQWAHYQDSAICWKGEKPY